MPNSIQRAKYMQWRDAFKSANQCEREQIGADADYDEREYIIKDGGDGQQINQFMRETTRRLNRLEDRMAIGMRFGAMILGSIIMATFVGLLLAFVLG